MNKTRIPIMIVILSLVIAAFFAVQTLQVTTGAQDKNQLNIYGMGDLHRFEAQNSIPKTNSLKSLGMGDLHRFEAQNMFHKTTGLKSLGMGDLHRFEAQNWIPNTGAKYAPFIPPVCPYPSTPDGERDAGASLPAYVPRRGCPPLDGK